MYWMDGKPSVLPSPTANAKMWYSWFTFLELHLVWSSLGITFSDWLCMSSRGKAVFSTARVTSSEVYQISRDLIINKMTVITTAADGLDMLIAFVNFCFPKFYWSTGAQASSWFPKVTPKAPFGLQPPAEQVYGAPKQSFYLNLSD